MAKGKKSVFSVRTVDMKSRSGWGSVRHAKSGIPLQRRKLALGRRGVTAGAKSVREAQVVALSQVSAEEWCED